MDKSLDMSLDDIIKSKKTTGRARRRAGPRRGGGARESFRGGNVIDTGRGAGRKVTLGVTARPSSFTISKSSRRNKKFPWQRDLLEDSFAAAGLPRPDSETKLHLSNLDRGVSNNDIRELFSEIGELKRYAVHFDKNGRPSGTAEVVYVKRSDAFAAYKRYNNVQLDGRPMKIDIVGPPSELPISARINVVGGASGKPSRSVVLTQNTGRPISSAPTNGAVSNKPSRRRRRGTRNGGQGQAQTQTRTQTQGQGQGQGRRRRGGRGRGKKQPLEKSAEELDKELDSYHAEAMET